MDHEAGERIRSFINETPLVPFDQLGNKLGINLFLKLESEQVTGSFKIRGSTNFMLKYSERGELQSGFVTASAGCHAIAVSTSAQMLNVKNGLIYVPNHINPCKEDILRQHGANVCKVESQDEAEETARRISIERGIPYISPYNDIDIISGQGTIGSEIIKQLPNVEAVFCPVGGGGLTSGVSAAMKAHDKSIRVVGCEVETSRALSIAVLTGQFVDVPVKKTLATALFGGIETNAITVDICRENVDDWVAVTEDEIETAIYTVHKHLGKRIEGGAGVALAGVTKSSAQFQGKNVVCVISGCHLDDKDLNDIIAKKEGKL